MVPYSFVTDFDRNENLSFFLNGHYEFLKKSYLSQSKINRLPWIGLNFDD